jgi:SHS2 domain-containing protein
MTHVSDIYELIDHTADIGVRVHGLTMSELFEHAAFALFDVMFDISDVQPVLEREFACRSDSIEDLLVEWLGNLLYVFDTERVVFSRFSVEMIEPTMLVAHAGGEFYDADRHDLKTLIKAVTYHGLCVQQTQAGFAATVIFDT